MAVTIACVLRSGGGYRPEHVVQLREQVTRLHPDVRFVCLSDLEVSFVETAPLLFGWPGWWSKIELFRPGTLTGSVVYFDLDTVITGALDELLGYRGDLALLSDFYRPDRAQSGVMLFRAESMADVFRLFRDRASRWMAGYRGDGEWLHDHAGAHDRIQDRFPDLVVSYKVHCRGGVAPAGARVVCAHGRPKPWDSEWRLAPEREVQCAP